MPDEFWLRAVIGPKSKSNVTGEFDATSRRSIETVVFVAEMNLPESNAWSCSGSRVRRPSVDAAIETASAVAYTRT